MNEPADDKLLEDYLRRKSALSLGYKKVYVEAPPPELDRAVKARAKRALTWLVPAVISLTIAVTVLLSTSAGINKWLGAMVTAEQSIKKTRAEHAEAQRKKEMEGPVVVTIDAGSSGAPAQKSRAAWLQEIEALRKAGRNEEAEAELRRLRAVYPDAN